MIHQKTIAVCLVVTSAVCTGCIPYYGLGKRRVPPDPIAFTDAITRQPIPAVLVIGRYTAASGVGSGGGHGPGAMCYRLFVAHPFVYHDRQVFAPRQPKVGAVVLVLPDAALSSGAMLDGVLVAAPGYKSQWVWDLWSKERSPTPLTPVSVSAGRAELEELLAIIDQERLSKSDAGRFSFAGNDPVYVRLTGEDKETMRAFLSDGLATLR